MGAAKARRGPAYGILTRKRAQLEKQRARNKANRPASLE